MQLMKMTIVALVMGASQLASLPAAESIDILRNVAYVQRDTGKLKADFYLPKTTATGPGVLVVHGGAWIVGNKSHMDFIGRRLAEEGFVAMSIQYRLAPQAIFPAQIEDCQAAVRFLREHAQQYHVDPSRIAGYGYSAGGQLVALLGTLPDTAAPAAEASPDTVSTRLQAVVAGGAPCDFRPLPVNSTQLAYWLGGTRADKPEAYECASPACYVSSDDPPMLLFHGEEDSLVPILSPQAMVAQLTAAGVKSRLYTVPKAGHIAAFRDQAAIEEAVKFLKAELLAAAGPTVTGSANVESQPAAASGAQRQ
jgi:acetyl esterase/lipase